MDLRAGSPTAERRTRSRSLRGTILARPSPSCAHDDDRICLPPASPPFNSKAGKKESTGHRPSRLYQPCATPSSNSSLDHHRSDVRIAENGFATSSSVSESAKVVLEVMAGIGAVERFVAQGEVGDDVALDHGFQQRPLKPGWVAQVAAGDAVTCQP